MYQKTSIKIKFFTTHGGYKTSRNKCRTILYSRCLPKNFFKKLSRFFTHDGYKKFLNKGRTILYSGYVPNISIKIKFFYYSRWITVDTKLFLKNAGRYFTQCVCQKPSFKTELLLLITLDTFFSKQLKGKTLLTV